MLDWVNISLLLINGHVGLCLLWVSGQLLITANWSLMQTKELDILIIHVGMKLLGLHQSSI